MSTPVWQPGTAYAVGDIVTPRTTDVVVTAQPNNNSFESGLTHWHATGEYMSNGDAQASIEAASSEAFQGTQSVTVLPTAGDGTGPKTNSGRPVGFVVLTNDFQAPVTPGQVINFKSRAFHSFVSDTNQTFPWSSGARIAWFDASHTLISYDYASKVSAGSPVVGPAVILGVKGMFAHPDSSWVTLSGTGTAPANAAYAAAVIVIASTDYGAQNWYADDYTWDYTSQGFPTGLVFVCTIAGTSAPTEPAWPVDDGDTVVDGTVTWQGEFASQITWTAESILHSGLTEPTWTLTIGTSVIDNSIVWTANDGRVLDPNCPQSKIVAIASAKIFAADEDIIRFSATANALDWSSSQDAGFIPFGLQTYGNENCKGLGLYRSNLVATNTLGYQMWQVDPDPNNIAILDAEPVGCGYHKTIQPVNNDLVFLSPVGLRNIGTAGSAGNLQAGQFGKNVDPLVKRFLNAALVAGFEPKALFNPGTGQYWLILGQNVIVLTINGATAMSWSRYKFPAVITDFTVRDGVLYVRADDLVWELNEDYIDDDVDAGGTEGGTSTPFYGYMSWSYLDFGAVAVDKEMEGFDVIIGVLDEEGLVDTNDITANITFGYNQADAEQSTDPYEVTGDTVPGTMIPMNITFPTIQVRLDFGHSQQWGWAATTLYLV